MDPIEQGKLLLCVVTVFNLFAEQFKQHFLAPIEDAKKTGTKAKKTKMHLDNTPSEDGGVVFDPRMEWCLILFLDASVTLLRDEVSKKSRRRDFDQLEILKLCLEGESQLDEPNFAEASGADIDQGFALLYKADQLFEGAGASLSYSVTDKTTGCVLGGEQQRGTKRQIGHEMARPQRAWIWTCLALVDQMQPVVPDCLIWICQMQHYRDKRRRQRQASPL